MRYSDAGAKCLSTERPPPLLSSTTIHAQSVARSTHKSREFLDREYQAGSLKINEDRR